MATRDDKGTYWNATADSAGFPALSGGVSVEVAVIEGRRVGRQVTGKSDPRISGKTVSQVSLDVNENDLQ